MGTLVGWHYPTNLFARLADHTYVACGNGAARWKCWGGDSGGKPLVQGTGSTLRAEAIAGNDGKAGITCYLVNGVCHQAANRILLPARVTVVNAKGYFLSESLFGPYGRPRGALGTCRAPFNQHTGVTGDLPQCLTTPLTEDGQDPDTISAADMPGDSERHQEYLERTVALYQSLDNREFIESTNELMDFQGRLFAMLLDYRLGAEFSETGKGREITGIRMSLEERRLAVEERFFDGKVTAAEFAGSFNTLTDGFQENVGKTLDAEEYVTFFGTQPDDTIVLSTPDIVSAVYNDTGRTQ